MNFPVRFAIKHFFPTSAFDLVYSEAVANAFDADATQISINIDMDAFGSPDTLRLIVRDNGVGFTDDNYDRFRNLMMVKDKQHKGLGRLVYLQYFDSVEIESAYEGGHRLFVFEDEVKECEAPGVGDKGVETFSELRFGHFKGQQIKSYDYVTPLGIKRQIRDLFMPKLFALKKRGVNFNVSVTLSTREENPAKGFVNGTQTLTPDDIVDFTTVDFDAKDLDLVDYKCKLLYHIKTGVSSAEHRLTTALCVDGRTIPFKIAASDQLFPGTSATFLLESVYFNSKTNESRQELALDTEEREKVSLVFTERIAEILNAEIPQMKKHNIEVKASLDERFPHLAGYFNQNTVGLINRNKAIVDAQAAFCRDEKDVLDATELTDSLYAKSLAQASRVLAQYFLYRNKIIRKMEAVTSKNRESDIHSLIVPMQRTFESGEHVKDIYNNNVWLLDDKYMTYQCVLSDKHLKELMERISSEEEKTEKNLRPDVAIVFSEDVDRADHPVDVVIVELKRKGLDHLGKYAIIEQIKQRARRLVSLYPTKIQRLWFFGIIDFDREIRNSLKEDGWMPLYSKGESYYQELSVLRVDADDNELPGGKVPVAVTLLSQDALWQDALARNETFLSILRESIRNQVRS